MDFINETTWDALAFEAMDQHGSLFDVVCVKAGFSLHVDGMLMPLPEPTPLATEDEAFGELNATSPRWESDLAPFKPKCDVLVNASAWAPGGEGRRFEVRLRMTCPNRAPLTLPAPPQGLNPFMNPSPDEMAAWERECARTQSQPRPDTVLIDKTLVVTGPRLLKQKWLPVRAFWGVLRIASLGLIRRSPWKLSRPGKATSLPLRYEAAWGGEHKFLSLDPTSRRVKAKHHLPDVNSHQLREAALAGSPDQPIAHVSCPGNHLGHGFAPTWCLHAAQLTSLPAPQVERKGLPFTGSAFWRTATGKDAGLVPEGLGPVHRTWLPRVRFAGNPSYPDHFEEDEFPGLPKDFDFRFWNCAPEDQQIPYPEGGETLELVNLCAPDHPAATHTRDQTPLRFELPRIRPFLVLEDEQGRLGARPLDLDTILVEPDENRVLLTYRAVVPQEAGIQSAVLKLQHPDALDQLTPMLALMKEGASHVA